MKWWQWLICIAIILIGSFCAIDSYKMITAGNKTTGQYKYVPNYYSSFFKENLVAMALTDSDGDGYFTYEKTFAKQEFDGTKKAYLLMVNNLPCYTQTVKAGAIQGNFKMDFKDTDNNTIGSVDLNISISFLDSGTKVVLGCKDENNAILNLTDYASNNNFFVEVVEVTNG